MGMATRFQDRVTDFGSNPGFVSVLFADRPAEYRLAVDRVDFAAILSRLAASWKERAEVSVEVEGNQIVAVG